MKIIFDIDKSGKPVLVTDQINVLRRHFSVADPTAKIKKLKCGGYIPSKLYCITPTGRFQYGMFHDIMKYLKGSGIKYSAILTEKFKASYRIGYEEKPIKELSIPLRDYQKECIEKSLALGHGTSVIATAGGKTLIMATLMENIFDRSKTRPKILVIVPGISLVEQTYEDFIEYGGSYSVSKWSGNNAYDKTSDVVVAGAELLRSKSTDPALYIDFDVVLIDEVHKLKKKNKINKILDKIKTKRRFGFTGTLPDDQNDIWNVIGKTGPILIEKSSKNLRDEKYISDAFIQVIRIDYFKKFVYKTKSTFLTPTAKYEEESEYLNNNSYRNGIIASLASKVDNNILVLVDRIEHGELLTSFCSLHAPEKKIYFIQGSTEVNSREKIRGIMEEETNVICIAVSSIFSTGINIKNLHYIMFTCGGKAKVKIIQSIGRGLRLHENKSKLICFDITDKLQYSEEHLEKRLKLYKKEGLKYGIKEINQK